MNSLAQLLWQGPIDEAHPAIVADGRTTTYADLRSNAAAVAEHLAERGIEPGDRVALFVERNAAAVAAYFGILAAGGVAVFVNERVRPRQVEYIVGHSGARFLIVSRELSARQPRAIAVEHAEVLDISTLAGNAEFTPVERSAGDLANIIYTSGSTGMPKGVAHTHRGLREGVDIVSGYLGIRPDDRTASLLSLSSVYGLNQMLCAVATGSTLVIERSPLAAKIVGSLRDTETTVLAAVPALWFQLLSVPEFRSEPIRSLRLLQNAGGHLPVEIVRQVRHAQPQARLFLQYGQTETFRGTFLPPQEVDQRPDCMGKAIPRSEIVIVRDDLTPCDPGEVGQLVHVGPTVAAGYWNDPQATARTFKPYPFDQPESANGQRAVLSGDMARMDEDGYLYFVSRQDRLIKTLGFRVGPDEIGDVVFASGEVAEVVITTEPDKLRGARVVAYVVLKPEGDLERLKRYCGTELPRHMQPARFEARDALPRLPSGKYDVSALGVD